MRYIIAFILAILLAGCGGGGGGSSTDPGDAVRQLVAGDQVVYSFSGTVDDTISPKAATGTVTLAVESSAEPPTYGGNSLTLSYTCSLDTPDTHINTTVRRFIEQAPDGTIYDHGSGGRNIVVTTGDPVIYPARCKASVIGAYRADYSDVTTEVLQWRMDITETEHIYAINRHLFQPDGVTVIREGDEIFDPATGFPTSAPFYAKYGGYRFNGMLTQTAINIQ